MKYEIAVAAVVCTVIVSGCDRLEVSADKTEKATVVDLVYTPAIHGNGQMGFTSGGDVTYTMGVETQPIYAVVFECQHGKFIVEGTDLRHRTLWNKMQKGEKVVVIYNEQYRVDDNKHTRTLIGYKFVDADRDVGQ